MSQNLTISETGLKLIKAFEGFRPVDRELITGQRVVGYGHRLYSEDAVMMNKGEAEEVLKTDLEPFEDMINTEVHAPMTQSQLIMAVLWMRPMGLIFGVSQKLTEKPMLSMR